MDQQTPATAEAFAIPEEISLNIMLLLNQSSQLRFAKTCTTLYARYVKRLLAFLYVGNHDESMRLSIRDSSKIAQHYMDSNYFLNFQFIQPKELSDFQSSVRYPIKGLYLNCMGEDTLLSVIGDLNEGFISSLASLELHHLNINARTASIFSKLSSLEYLCLSDCSMIGLDTSETFTNPSKIQKLELISNTYEGTLKLPQLLKGLIISGSTSSVININASGCTQFETV